jgi:hypothetical protein
VDGCVESQVKTSASVGATGRHPAGGVGMRPPRGAERLSAVGTARHAREKEVARGVGLSLWGASWAEAAARAQEALGRLWPAGRRGGGGPLGNKN